jgi:hypothetical protein
MAKNARLAIDFNCGFTAEEREVIGPAIERLMKTMYAIDGTAVFNLEEGALVDDGGVR